MNTRYKGRLAAAAGICVLVGLSFSGCGGECETCPPPPPPSVRLTGVGIWDVKGERSDCTTNEVLSTGYQEEKVCPDDSDYDVLGLCSISGSGNNYTLNCTIPVVSAQCSGTIQAVMNFAPINSRSYTVDGTITIVVEPAGCLQEWLADFGADGCARVHEVHTWRESVSPEICGLEEFQKSGGDAAAFDPFVEISAAIHRHLVEYVNQTAG
ncbi:MAG: hypothetical protein IPG61_16115 [bacterium]|jgi:hypothetical protein|nr:hypothetical protein [bacterium]